MTYEHLTKAAFRFMASGGVVAIVPHDGTVAIGYRHLAPAVRAKLLTDPNDEAHRLAIACSAVDDAHRHLNGTPTE